MHHASVCTPISSTFPKQTKCHVEQHNKSTLTKPSKGSECSSLCKNDSHGFVELRFLGFSSAGAWSAAWDSSCAPRQNIVDTSQRPLRASPPLWPAHHHACAPLTCDCFVAYSHLSLPFVSLRGDLEDPHCALVVSRWHEARLRHHQRLPRPTHGAPHLHGLCLPHSEALPLPQGTWEKKTEQMLLIIHACTPHTQLSQCGNVLIRRVYE